MGTGLAPRIVVASRPTEWDRLVARHATPLQAAFFLETRAQAPAPVQSRADLQEAARVAVSAAIPMGWRRTELSRDDFPSFLFEPGDIVVAVGQDGLVPNLAKYLDGQPVIGINPDPGRYEGVLVRFPVESAGDAIEAVHTGAAAIEERTMVTARVDDGREIVALNEVFVGHRTHQSARYRLETPEGGETQSSSGVIVATGTGATGWARSISNDRGHPIPLPEPTEPTLAWFVREAWPSVQTGATLTAGTLTRGEAITVIAEMNDGGVCFGDGMEDDHLPVSFGQSLTIAAAGRRLRLVAGF